MADFDSPEDYDAVVAINKHDLDRELELQAAFTYLISEHRSAAALRVSQTKDQLSVTEAQLRARIRRSGGGREGPKQTEADILAAVQEHRDRLIAWDDYQNARHMLDRWEGLFETWKQRGFALSKLGELFQANYYTVDSAGGRTTEDKDWQRGRIALKQARSSREPLARRKRAVID